MIGGTAVHRVLQLQQPDNLKSMAEISTPETSMTSSHISNKYGTTWVHVLLA